MKILVVYYSKTGNTGDVAKIISENIQGDLVEIIDKKNRDGVINYFIAALDAIRKKSTVIEYDVSDISAYDIVIIGTPIWAGTIAPAIRTFIEENKAKLNDVAFFVTVGGTDTQGAFDLMVELTDKKPIDTLSLNKIEIGNNEIYNKKIDDFSSKLLNIS